MIGSYEDWQNMAVQMRDERDKALDEVDRLKKEIKKLDNALENQCYVALEACEAKAEACTALRNLEKLLSEERERYELLAGDYAGADTDRKQLAKALEEANALLLRWCTAFSMGPLSDQYLRQESKTFLISNYPKHKP